MQKLENSVSTTGMLHTLKSVFLKALRNPAFNLALNVLMLVMNGVASVSQFLVGNYVLGNLLLVSTISCLSAVAYWAFFVWDSRN